MFNYSRVELFLRILLLVLRYWRAMLTYSKHKYECNVRSWLDLARVPVQYVVLEGSRFVAVSTYPCRSNDMAIYGLWGSASKPEWKWNYLSHFGCWRNNGHVYRVLVMNTYEHDRTVLEYQQNKVPFKTTAVSCLLASSNNLQHGEWLLLSQGIHHWGSHNLVQWWWLLSTRQ